MSVESYSTIGSYTSYKENLVSAITQSIISDKIDYHDSTKFCSTFKQQSMLMRYQNTISNHNYQILF